MLRRSVAIFVEMELHGFTRLQGGSTRAAPASTFGQTAPNR